MRLEPLGVRHVPGLLKAAVQDPSLYQWVMVPQDEPAMRRHVEDALAARAKGIAVPFAVVRLDDETVIGSTRFHQLDYWARPVRMPRGTTQTPRRLTFRTPARSATPGWPARRCAPARTPR